MAGGSHRRLPLGSFAGHREHLANHRQTHPEGETMIKSKRLLALGVVAALGFTAAACGSDDDAQRNDRRTSRHRGHRSTRRHRGAGRYRSTCRAAEAPAGSEAPAGECDAVDRHRVRHHRSRRQVVQRRRRRGPRPGRQPTRRHGIRESTPTGDGDRAERLQGSRRRAATASCVGVGFLFGDSITAASPPRTPTPASPSSTRVVEAPTTWRRSSSPRSRARSSSVPPRR